MVNERRDILETLQAELEFIEKGGYRQPSRRPCRPRLMFLDSPTCLNSNGRQRCEECVLFRFVPSEHRNMAAPCHRIPLNDAGDTVDSAERWASQEELEELVVSWLRHTIMELEKEGRPETASACGAR